MHALDMIPWVNFTNILRAAFSYERVVSSFFVLTFRFVIFRRKEIAARKMLVKLTLGLMFISYSLIFFRTSKYLVT